MAFHPLTLLRGAAILGAIATSAILMATPARADDRDFKLVNSSGQTVQELYVSSVELEDWEEDVLGENVLESGDQVSISFDPEVAGQCQYDILVVTENKAEVEVRDVNLCQQKIVVFDGEELVAN